MKKTKSLNGWNNIVYTLIRNKFQNNLFSLKELYTYEVYFNSIYPSNNFIREKIRQTLQNLVKLELLDRIENGIYKLIIHVNESITNYKERKDYVYLVSNESIPGWIKIGRTESIERRLATLYNTSVPFPFKLEKVILTKSKSESLILEKNIHNMIDILNPSLRKETAASKREFFNLSVENGLKIFDIVENINKVEIKNGLL